MFYVFEQDLCAFRIPHGVFVKLHEGTWHAGTQVLKRKKNIHFYPIIITVINTWYIEKLLYNKYGVQVHYLMVNMPIFIT